MMKSFETGFTPTQLRRYQKGVRGYEYKDVGCLKSPIDLAIYLRLIADAKPATIIEIGTGHGGSALLLHDLARMLGHESRVVSIDVKPPELDAPETLQFFKGNVRALGKVFKREKLYSLPRPWLVIEDSQHSFIGCLAAMKFFSKRLKTGEYLVVEGGVLEDLGRAEQFEGGPNKAIEEFFTKNPDEFEIAREYCDMFGANMTFNPNGYLRKL